MKSFKKIFLFAAMLFAALPSGAQIVSSSSMVITRKKLPDVKPGYEQSVDLSYSLLTDNNTALDINYIGGYRFNNTFFLGLGAGLEYNLTSGTVQSSEGYTSLGALPLPALNIPIYAHFRVYFMKSRVTPFIALSAGGRFSTSREFDIAAGPVKYGTCGALAFAAIGVNYRLDADKSLYLTIGGGGATSPYLRETSIATATVTNEFEFGLKANIGFTF